jgi:hypothetical protein
MTSKVYEEAIAEAKHLRQIAEESAKQKIVESLTPAIKKMIENQLMGDLEDEVMDMDPSESEDVPSEEEVQVVDLRDLIPDEDDSGSAAVDINVAGDLNVDSIDVEMSNDDDDDDDELILNTESAAALAELIKGHTSVNLSPEFSVVESELKVMSSFLDAVNVGSLTSTQVKTVCENYTKLLNKVVILKNRYIINECGTASSSPVSSLTRAKIIVKEMKKMAKRQSTKNLFKQLFEGDTGLNEAELVLGDEDLEGLGDEVDVTALEDILSDLEVSVEGGEEEAEEEVEAEDEEAETEEEAPVEVAEADHMEEPMHEEDLDEEDLEEGEDYMDEMDITISVDPSDDDEVVEIDENMLRREIARMRKLREEAEAATFGGPGEVEGDVVEDITDVELGALDDESGSVAETRTRRRRARARKINESRRNTALTKKLNEYRNAVNALRTQLVEMNLFNAKLLYANKLMQNRNLSTKQQRSIVEALDNAKTLREAKLLYKSLTSSLTKGSKKSLSESTSRKTLGSSSKSTRSAAPAKSGVEVDRWAILAGINNNN